MKANAVKYMPCFLQDVIENYLVFNHGPKSKTTPLCKPLHDNISPDTCCWPSFAWVIYELATSQTRHSNSLCNKWIPNGQFMDNSSWRISDAQGILTLRHTHSIRDWSGLQQRSFLLHAGFTCHPTTRTTLVNDESAPPLSLHFSCRVQPHQQSPANEAKIQNKMFRAHTPVPARLQNPLSDFQTKNPSEDS